MTLCKRCEFDLHICALYEAEEFTPCAICRKRMAKARAEDGREWENDD